MEVEEIQRQVCKIPRLGNGAPPDSGKIVRGGSDNYPDDEEEGGALIKRTASVVGDGGAAAASALREWHHHHSSRIIRVSRATGGKDRHSKVLTSRGLRDRRVRLSVTTAIQFYDLQDRLGYDQPSKAVEWLIKAAADAIAELPSLNPSNIPDTPRQLSDEKRVSDGTEQEVGTEPDGSEPTTNNFHQQNSQSQHLSLSKSACSSASDTSKNSGLTLARSDVRAGRAKARERARERTAKEKEKEQDQPHINHFSHQNSSFTELLTCGIGSNSSHNAPVSAAAPMDYFSGALFGAGASSRNPHSSSGFPGQIQLGTSLAQTMSNPTPFSISGDSSSSNNHPELQHYSFVPDHLFPVAATTASQQQQHEYNLNFSISPGLAVFNRGTLQSNSPSLLPHHLQRLSSPLDAPPFFISTSAVDHHNHNQQHQQFPTGFDGRALQLCYGDGTRDSDHKLKPRN